MIYAYSPHPSLSHYKEYQFEFPNDLILNKKTFEKKGTQIRVEKDSSIGGSPGLHNDMKDVEQLKYIIL